MESTQENTPKANKFLTFIGNSAPFALLLSIILFGVEFIKNDNEFDKTINDLQTIKISLKEVEQSLSTRYIGIFPDYLGEINKLLTESLESPKEISKIIIIEDVLFYGAFYNKFEFKKMIQQITEFSNKPGNEVIIACYDNNNKEWRKRRMFREVVQFSWMRDSDLPSFRQEIYKMADSLQKVENAKSNRPGYYYRRISDSIISEKYFARYRDIEREEFSKRLNDILTSFYNEEEKDYQFFDDFDKIKDACINKPVNTITYYDFYTMYNEVTEKMKDFLPNHKIKIIQVDDYLTMSCWSNGKKALFALPGRYSAEEIGFITHDKAILDYIDVMLQGISSSKNESINDLD